MTREIPPKSLKDQVRWQLWLTIGINFALFYTVAQSDAVSEAGLWGLVTGAANLLPVGAALIVTTIANGFLDAKAKARLVFLRWDNALPGHRAFSVHMASDPRIDVDRLKKSLGGKWPATPEEENRVWYRLYKEVGNDPAIAHVHREYLLTRDYAAFAFLFLIGFGPAAYYLAHSQRLAFIYISALVAQFLLARHSAATYGVRFVTSVLANKAAIPSRATSKTKIK